VGEVAGPAARVPPTAVLLGTEAVLHRVRRAAAVAFLDVDQHLLAPRFGAEEEALALVARAGRLVGARGQGGGPVLVQTRMPDHLVLAAAVHGDPERLAEQEAELRDALDLPPASALAALGGPGAEAFAAALASGPEPVATSALGDGRWLVRAPNHVQLCDALAQVPRPRERVRVEVDPTDV
jgi:primosomal protein N' (replication factor Y)